MGFVGPDGWHEAQAPEDSREHFAMKYLFLLVTLWKVCYQIYN